MSKGFASSYRLGLLAGGLLLCFGGIGVRLVQLHVVNRDAVLLPVINSRQQLIVETARRGDIRDARGAILATSRPQIVLGVDPSELLSKDEPKWPALARLAGLSSAELYRICTTKFRTMEPSPAPVVTVPAPGAAKPLFKLNLPEMSGATAEITPLPAAEDVPDAEPVAADAKGHRKIKWTKLSDEISESTYAEIEKLGIRGVTARRVYRRTYPQGQAAAHIIGYVNRAEQRAVTGIEAYTDFYLRGQNGWREGEKDGLKRELPQFRSRDVPSADGYSVHLSVQTLVQDIVEKELSFIAAKFKPLKATIIVSDLDGFILGLGNYPTFNLNEYNLVPREKQESMKNAAVTDVYDPGSVFKIVAAAAALEEGVVAADSLFDCSLETILHRGRVVDLPGEDHRFNHPLSVREIITHSSNKGAAQLAILVGEEKFEKYARAFGFGRKLGFPIGGEVPGIFRSSKLWHPIDITRFAIGHGISVTALQMHQAMSTIATGGVLLRPQILKEIRGVSGETVFRYDRTEMGRAVSERTAQLVADMLTGVVAKDGTAAEAAIPGYQVAGKTGTTQKLVEITLANGRKTKAYSNREHVASFVGFFPASRPQVVISVIVDDGHPQTPSGIAYGGVVAAPSFRNVGEKLISVLDIKPVPSSPSLMATTGGVHR